MGSSKPKKQTVGYKYYRSMFLGLCHGPLDAIRTIKIKDKVAWSGNLRRLENGASVTGYINQPGLFGGEDLEGGVQGVFEVGFGGFNQRLLGVNTDGTTSTAPLSAAGVGRPFMPVMGTQYRGIAVLNLLDFYWGVNPYLSDVAVEVERYWKDWFPETAQIGIDANPAHIIYEAVISDQWGMSYTPEQIDDDSMRVAAGILYSEGLGLSMSWSEQQSIEEFIGTILPQIDGQFYFNPKKGKWSLKLVRSGDPVVHRLDPSNFKLEGFTRRALGETVNELTARYVSPVTEEYVAITVQDTANAMATGQTIPGTKNYPGVRSEELVAKLGLRDLAALSSTLANGEGVADRSAWHLNPGDLVEMTWPAHGIELLRMRVTTTTFAQDSNDVKLALVEDVFGQELGSFNGTNEPGWQDGRRPPGQFDVLAPFELPYWFVFQVSSGAALADEVTFAGVLAVTTNTAILQAELHALRVTPTAQAYELVDAGNATPSALLSVALTREVTSTASLLMTSLSGASRVPADSYAVIGDGDQAEIVRVIGNVGGSITLQRGVMDTQPFAWPQGTRIFFLGDGSTFTTDSTARSMAEVVDYKVTMQTSMGKTELADVPVTSVLLEGRQGRPYPVANVTIAGTYWPATVVAPGANISVSWSTRNRLLQNGAFQLNWSESSVVPEAGTTVLVFAMQAGVVVSSVLVSDPAVNTASLPTSGWVNGQTTLVVRTIRGDLENYQDFQHTFTVSGLSTTGFGQSWGA